MYTYKDLEQLTGVSYPSLVQWKRRGFIEGEGWPLTFTEETALRAVWLAALSRAHIPLDQANELFLEALKRARKDPGVVMLLTHQGPKFFSNETHFKRLWSLVKEEGAVFQVISVGMFFQEIWKELEAIRKVRNFRGSIGLIDPESLAAVN